MPPLVKSRWLVPTILIVLVLLAVNGLILTRDNGDNAASRRQAKWNALVNQRPLQTARALAALATGREEQRFARQALRIADHEVDLAFASALRDAVEQPVEKTPQVSQAYDHANKAQAQVKNDQAAIEKLKKDVAAASSPAAQDNLQQQLSLMMAQSELDQDELADAKEELSRAGGDSRSRIQRLFERHQADEQHQTEAAAAQANAARQAPDDENQHLAAQLATWKDLYTRQGLLEQARDEAQRAADSLGEDHDKLAQQVNQEDVGKQALSQQAASQIHAAQEKSEAASKDLTNAAIASLRHLANDQKDLVDLTRRIRDHQELVDTYTSWSATVQTHRRAALHSILRSLFWIFIILLLVYETGKLIDRLFVNVTHEHKRLRTLRVVARFAVQAIGALVIIFMVLGTPAQMPTILGLAGAGLTVVMKDFIVAFFGWFVLVGRNGIHVGDWVEINGVVGEVAEITLMRTVLLETGNWNDMGHPTGRKVAFMNSYAIEGHYFNFSTTGQWLWDEIQVLIPTDRDPYPVIEAIQKLVSQETEASTRMAEQEWQRATSRYRTQPVSAAPAINLRPTSAGVEVHVRYITPASQRSETRTRLYQGVVELLHRRNLPQAMATAPAD